MVEFGLTHRWGIRQVCSEAMEHTVAPVAARHITTTMEGSFDKQIFCARQFRDNGLVWSPSKELIKGTCIKGVAGCVEEGKGAHEWGIWILNEGAEEFTRVSHCALMQRLTA